MELGYTPSYSFNTFCHSVSSCRCVGFATVSWLNWRGKCHAQRSDVLFYHYGKKIYSCILQLFFFFSFVYPTAIVDDERLSAEEMDERRRQNIAYEYLCHLEEAKQWVEVCHTTYTYWVIVMGPDKNTILGEPKTSKKNSQLPVSKVIA